MKRRIVSCLLLVASFNLDFSALAALPPLANDDLNFQASHVLIGYVYLARGHELNVYGGKDNIYTAKLVVYKSEKGGFAQNDIVRFTFRRVQTRPSGWTGPVGQSAVIKPHKTVRVWLSQDEQGNLNLLEPNGWEYADYSSQN